MLVMLLVVVGFVLLRDLTRVDPESPGAPVDYQQSATFAREQVGFEVLAPPALPDGWRATSVEFVPQPARWHLGLLTEEGRYVGLEQVDSSVESMVTTYVDDEATQGGDVTIEGRPWSTWTDDEGDTALVRDGREVTTLVVGPVEQDVLVDYVKILR
jgi:hypothetical protein